MVGLSDRVASGAIWVTCERFVTQAVSFAVSMVLARLLSPHDYGLVALLSIFFAVAGSLASCGFGNALVQKKEAGEIEFNSVFYTGLGVAFVIYGIFFFCAPYIAEFYGSCELTNICRVSASQFVFSAINSVQIAELSRKMLFYKRFRISLISCGVSGFCGIVLAYLGWGVWALVISLLVTNVVSCVAWWTIIAWRPKLMYSFAAVKGLFAYGWKLSLAGLIHTSYSNLYGFLVGKFYTPADLAYVNKGRSIPSLLMDTIDGTILGVSFPALAKMQDNKDRLREAMRRMIQTSTFLVFPLLTGLAICAGDIIPLLYGGRWNASIVYVQVSCITFALNPFNTINTSAISAMGRSDVYLLLDVIKKSTGLVVMILSIKYGVLIFMLSMAIVMSPFSVFVNTFANGRLLGYTPLMQIRDVAPSAILSAAMAVIILLVQRLISPCLAHLPLAWAVHLASIGISVVVGSVVYFVLAAHFRVAPFLEYVSIVLPVLKTRMPFVARMLEKLG